MKITDQSRGTRILLGADAAEYLAMIQRLSALAPGDPIVLPALDGLAGYAGAPGEMMRVHGPSAETVLCPERTSQVRRVARADDTPRVVWYCERCYRLERPQSNRYREFTQFGVEWLWPPIDITLDSVVEIASIMCGIAHGLEIRKNVTRGLHYYRGGETFEINAPRLAAQKQVCGGGRYDEGIGFAIGVERLIAAQNAPGL